MYAGIDATVAVRVACIEEFVSQTGDQKNLVWFIEPNGPLNPSFDEFGMLPKFRMNSSLRLPCVLRADQKNRIPLIKRTQWQLHPRLRPILDRYLLPSGRPIQHSGSR